MRNNIIKLCEATPEELEILNKLIEECAEVIQCCTKVISYGFESTNPDDPGLTNREHLQNEVGDAMCMVYLLAKKKVIDEESLIKSSEKKLDKLERYSNIEIED